MSNISLTRTAVWLPDTYEDGETIAKKAGLPVNVVVDKMGIKRKCRATKNIQPSYMAVEAAKIALKGIDPLSIDLVIWSGSEYKDHIVWSAGIFVQRELGLKNAWAFDIGARCSNKILALTLAKSLMQTNPNLNKVLICGGHKTGDLVNYNDPNTRFLYNLSDGGSAVLLERGNENCLLESSIITNGDFSLDVIIPAGGSKTPTRDNPVSDLTFLSVPDPEGMKNRLAECSIHNFIKVIQESAHKSFNNKSIDYLALLHMKKSAHNEVLKGVELKPEQSIYLENYGHFGAPDQILSLILAEKRGLLKNSSNVCLAAAGIGYTWSAISFIWNKPTCMNENFTELI